MKLGMHYDRFIHLFLLGLQFKNVIPSTVIPKPKISMTIQPKLTASANERIPETYQLRLDHNSLA